MAVQLNCGVCGTGFGGRSDAIYCSPACRQKAHRGRTARRVEALAAQRPGLRSRRRFPAAEVTETIRRAQHEQRRARELCRAAAATQRRVLASQRWTASQRVALALREGRPYEL